jgi:flagellar motor protein MotB
MAARVAALRAEFAGEIARGDLDIKRFRDGLVIRVNAAVGFTDAETLKLYPTSWHLGAARSANVVQYLQVGCGMDPLQLVAASLGEFRPQADNGTEAGRALNRGWTLRSCRGRCTRSIS